jgi:transcriptional regulator with XRE-family HTH domain
METYDELLERVKKALEGKYLTFIAEKTGLHYNTIWKLAQGKTKPSEETLQKLAKYLFG